MTLDEQANALDEMERLMTRHADLMRTCSTMGEVVEAMPLADAERFRELVALTGVTHVEAAQ